MHCICLLWHCSNRTSKRTNDTITHTVQVKLIDENMLIALAVQLDFQNDANHFFGERILIEKKNRSKEN